VQRGKKKKKRIARTAPTPGGAKTCIVHRSRAASARRKDIETIKNNVVWTVSDGDYVEVERKVERRLAE
jgi:hypothetical protein